MLAPVSVDIHHQNKGIGKRLIQALEREAILKGYNFISVLGWPTYYANLGISTRKYVRHLSTI